MSLLLYADEEVLESFAETVQSLWIQSTTIPVLSEPPSALEFLRDYVAVSRPCIIRNTILVPSFSHDDDNDNDKEDVCRDVRPLHLTVDDLAAYFQTNDPTTDEQVLLTVDCTPDGHGDCLRQVQTPSLSLSCQKEKEEILKKAATGDTTDALVQTVFVRPEQRKMTFSTFRDKLRKQQQHKEAPPQQDEHSSCHSCRIRNRIFSGKRLRVAEINNKNDDDKESNDNDDDNNEDGNDDGCIVYYSLQNDCLRTELSCLWNDSNLFPKSFPWAEQAFGVVAAGPDAVNLWMGNERSVSAMHKDHYENLFYVLSGEKVFTVSPPCSVAFLNERPFGAGTFVSSSTTGTTSTPASSSSAWHVQLDKEDDDASSQVPWISAHVQARDGTGDKFNHPHEHDCPCCCCLQQSSLSSAQESSLSLQKYAHGVMQEIRVQAGDMLYLPSLWFHAVTQTTETVAINYWYDMRFDSPHWCYFHLMQSLKQKQKPSTQP